MFVYIYMFYLKILQNISNFMNLGEIYIFLCQQLESGKRLLQLFDTCLTKKSGIRIKAKLLKSVMQNVVIINRKMGVITHFTEKLLKKIHTLRQMEYILCRWSLVIALYHKQYFQIVENIFSLLIFVSWPWIQKYWSTAKTMERVQSRVSGAGF